MKAKIVYTYVPEPMKKRFKALCSRKGWSMNQVVFGWIEEFLRSGGKLELLEKPENENGNHSEKVPEAGEREDSKGKENPS